MLSEDLLELLVLGYKLSQADIDNALRALEATRNDRRFKASNEETEHFLDVCMLIFMALKSSKGKLKIPYRNLLRKYPEFETEFSDLLNSATITNIFESRNND